MQKNRLGRSELMVSPLAFGGNVFGWTVDEKTSFALLDAFIAAGFNFIDTADVYSRWVKGNEGGESERIIGKWLKQSGKRDQVVIATKVGMEMGSNAKGLSKAYIMQAIEHSLARLQTDYIDLYQAHIFDETTPCEETLEAFTSLAEQGKVRVIGASNHTASQLARTLNTSDQKNLARYESLQPLYNLYDRHEYEAELEVLCRQQELGVISYFSLASGFLTGKYRSEKDLAQGQRGEMVRKYLNPRGLNILAALDKVSQQYQAIPAQVALAWLIARPSITAAIASATSIKQLQDLVKATQLQLDVKAIDLLNEASAV